ncbi:MAG: sporadic carbohydrate cluster 2OG-Fe(II) oxygenase [Rhodospirillaceae bacterium]
MNQSFISKDDADLTDEFVRQGYVIRAAEDIGALDILRRQTASAAANALGIELPEDIGGFLNGIQNYIQPDGLNAMRLTIIDSLMSEPDFHANYFKCAKSLVESLASNELAMQRNIGLSVQLPGDEGSLLPLHSDAWGSECSPFEVVLWIPLVDCFDTKSMFLLPPEANAAWVNRLPEFEDRGIEALYKEIEPHLSWINIKYGDVLVFTPSGMHGNRVNGTAETRWSFNLRFKGLFTPYSGKRLGEYFMPISLRPASRVGLEFEMPGGFND